MTGPTPPTIVEPVPETSRRTRPEDVERTSHVIARIAAEWDQPEITLGDIIHVLRDRSFGVLMILFAMPNAVIPGISAILGTPILIFAVMMVLGYREPWLPGFIRKRSLSIERFREIAARVVKFLEWLEKYLKPRLVWLTSPVAERFLGAYLGWTAIVLAAPIPWGNPLPAFGISFISAGLMEEDGVAVIIGVILGLLGTAYIAFSLGALYLALQAGLAWLGIPLF